MQCKTCTFFESEATECRAMLPALGMQRWPRVYETDWCAGWKISDEHKSVAGESQLSPLQQQIEENRREVEQRRKERQACG